MYLMHASELFKYINLESITADFLKMLMKPVADCVARSLQSDLRKYLQFNIRRF